MHLRSIGIRSKLFIVVGVAAAVLIASGWLAMLFIAREVLSTQERSIMHSWAWRNAASLCAIMLGLILGPAAGRADTDYPVTEGDVVVHDITFRDGERLESLTLHYTALGAPRRDGGGRIVNAVLVLHGATGTGKSFLAPSLAGALFGAGQPLDAQRYYIVLPDGIGAGGSSKPSDGLRSHFPHYGYLDQVETQHRLLEGLGIDHLRLVSGISQGGMQTWLWGERYPDAMDGLLPIASMPMEISGRNLLWRRMIMRAIEHDPGWRGGDYDAAQPPTQWMETAAPMFALMVGNANRIQAEAPDRAATLAYFDRLVAQFRGRDAADTYYDFDSSRDYNPAPDLGLIKAPLLAINFTDDMVNPAEFAQTRQAIERLPQGRLLMVSPEPMGYGHGAIFHASLWAAPLGEFLEALPVRR